MADGFLAPTGKFYPKTENFHAQTARAILGPDGQNLLPRLKGLTPAADAAVIFYL